MAFGVELELELELGYREIGRSSLGHGIKNSMAFCMADASGWTFYFSHLLTKVARSGDVATPPSFQRCNYHATLNKIHTIALTLESLMKTSRCLAIADYLLKTHTPTPCCHDPINSEIQSTYNYVLPLPPPPPKLKAVPRAVGELTTKPTAAATRSSIHRRPTAHIAPQPTQVPNSPPTPPEPSWSSWSRQL
jgi:hypothetical protein